MNVRNLILVVMLGGFATLNGTAQSIYFVNDQDSTGDRFTTALGSDSNPGTVSAPFASIQKAVQLVGAGGQVYVDAGTYTEQITISKNMFVYGAGCNVSVVRLPDSTAPAPGDFFERGTFQTVAGLANVHLSGFSISGRLSVGLETITPVIIQGGGSVRNCILKEGNQGVFFRLLSGVVNASVDNNAIEAEFIGINFEGSGIRASMTNNNIRVFNSGFSAGVFAGSAGTFSASGNSIGNYVTVGFQVASNVSITQNSIVGRSGSAIAGGGGILATCNWYGSDSLAVIQARLSGGINFTPWLIDGRDADTVAMGFQPMPNTCFGGRAFYVNNNSIVGDVFTTAPGNDSNPGTKAAPFATIPRAYDVAPAGSAIFVDAGLYDFAGTPVFIAKPLAFFGTNHQISPNSSSNPLQTNTSRNAETIVKGVLINVLSPSIKFQGFTFEQGTTSLVALSNTTSTNNNFGNFTFTKNIVKAIHPSGTAAQITLTGVHTSAASLPVTAGFFITENRFEKTNNVAVSAITTSYTKQVLVDNNVFVTPAPATQRTYITCVVGQNGQVSNFSYSNNVSTASRYDLFTIRLDTALVENNRSLQSLQGLFVQAWTPGSSSAIIRGNHMETDFATTSPINFAAFDGFQPGSQTSVLIELNTVIQNAASRAFVPPALTIQMPGASARPAVTILRNRLSFAGDYGMFTTANLSGMRLAGRLQNVKIDENELNFTGANITNTPPANAPALAGIFLNADGGSNALTGDAVINITRNTIAGFKNSLAIYDASNTVPNTYTGYGNLPGGVTLNVNNNSFTGDSLSVNNGAIGQLANAGCNWYGSADAGVVAGKVSATVRFAPFLLNGNDLSSVTGFQPAAGSCAGLTGFSPLVGTAGTVVVLRGQGFAGTSRVAFNGTTATNLSVTSDSTIVVTVPPAATTGTLAITSPLGTIVSASNFFVIPPAEADTVGACPGSNGLLISATKGTVYQWQIVTDTGNTNLPNGLNYNGVTTDSLGMLNIDPNLDGRRFRCLVDGQPTTKIFTLRIANSWSGGGSDSRWNNAFNWGCSGQVPNPNTNVVIGSGTVVVLAAATAKSIWVSPGATLRVEPGVTLTITPQ